MKSRSGKKRHSGMTKKSRTSGSSSSGLNGSRRTKNPIAKTLKKGELLRKGYQLGYAEASKAFGGCTKCYGKGYATTMESTTYHADFPGDRTVTVGPKVEINYCSCDRGKQLAHLLKPIFVVH